MSRARHAAPRRRMTGRTEQVTGWLACAGIVTAGVLGVAPPAFAADPVLVSLPTTANPPEEFFRMSPDGSTWTNFLTDGDEQIVNWRYSNGDPIVEGLVPGAEIVGSVWVTSPFCTELQFKPPVTFDSLPADADVISVEMSTDGTTWTALQLGSGPVGPGGTIVDGYNFPTSDTELNNVGTTVAIEDVGQVSLRITFGDVPEGEEGFAPTLHPWFDCKVPMPAVRDSQTVAQGGTLPFTGSGFTPGATITVSDGGALTETVIALDDGTISGSFAIPADMAIGAYELSATDPVTSLEATWPFQVTAPGPTPTVTVTITETATVPGPTVTVTETVPGPTVTETVTAPPEPAPTVTVTTTPAPGPTVTVTAAPPAGSWSTGGTSRGSTTTGTTPSRGPLAETGANVGQLAMLAAGAVLAGTWLTLRTRRRLYEP